MIYSYYSNGFTHGYPKIKNFDPLVANVFITKINHFKGINYGK